MNAKVIAIMGIIVILIVGVCGCTNPTPTVTPSPTKSAAQTSAEVTNANGTQVQTTNATTNATTNNCTVLCIPPKCFDRYGDPHMVVKVDDKGNPIA